MAKFVYRMQNILDIKSKLEMQARNEYAQANAALMEEQEKLTGFVFRKKTCESSMKKEFEKSPMDLQDIDYWKSSILYMDECIKEQTVQVMKAQKNADLKKEQMLELMKERKTHELLKETAFEQFKQELKAAESKETDELVSYKYGIKQNESR